jgi:hypothetical protein
MKRNEALSRLFEWDVAKFVEALPDETSSLWEADCSRQQAPSVHAQTRSILFEWLANSWVPGTPLVVERYHYAPKALIDAVYDASYAILAHVGHGRIVKLALAELGAGRAIAPHRDVTPSLTYVHRCHLPIVTNRTVCFEIDAVTYWMAPGTVYEFDNTRQHRVVNKGMTRRVHLLCDVMP